ncbi:MAG: OsmC family protein [Methyloligellaceae bacterium]
MKTSFADLYQRTHSGLKSGTATNPITVTVSSQNQGGFKSRISMRDHTIVSDQPFGFEGTNEGPKPSELVLAALAACQEVTWRLYADAMDVPLDGISIELRGVQDLRGFLGVDDGIPAGFVSIEGDVVIDSPASREELEQLQRKVDAHCPVLDDLMRSVPVALTMRRQGG